MVPKERLIALQWFDLDKLAEEEEEFRIMWKEKKRCMCVSKLKEDQLPWCEHIRGAARDKFKEKEEKIWQRTLTIGLKSLSNNKAFNERFNRFEDLNVHGCAKCREEFVDGQIVYCKHHSQSDCEHYHTDCKPESKEVSSHSSTH